MSELKHAATGTGVELRYGDLVALTSCDFVVPAGRTTAVIGPNGSGKSTLLAAIAGIHEPSTGSVTVLETTPQEASPRVAFVPQSTKVNDALPVTVQEVVMMGRYPSLGFLRRFGEPDRTAVAGAIERLNLSDLSARHRDMLLLDEPMTGLDGVSAVVVNGVIREERAEGRTVVVTTHDLEEAQACDHVILVNGTVVAQGTPDDVLTAEILSEVYRSQVVDLEGRLLFDDPAHATHAPRHVHSDRAASTHPHDDV